MKMDIGNILRETRERKGLSLSDIENETKIRAKYLAALEAEDFKEIPGEAYVIGFLRNYARFLGLDADELVNRYKSQIKDNEIELSLPSQTEPSQLSETEERRSLWGVFLKRKDLVLSIILVILIILALIMGLLRGNTSHRQQSTTHKTVVNTSPNTKVNQSQFLTLELVATDKCWVRVTTDGTEKFTGMLYPGMNKKFQAKNTISLRLGNAGGVQVIYNGKIMPPLGKKGAVVEKEFRKSE